MLTHPTLARLESLKLTGMVKALTEQLALPEAEGLSFLERLGLLVDREETERQSRRLSTRLRAASLREQATIEDLDFRSPRGLDRALVLSLGSCDWIRRKRNVLISGPTGTGKTYLGCALAHTACREDFSALYVRLPRLLADLGLARADGRYGKLLAKLARTDLLVCDDLGLVPLCDQERHDLLEILEDRHGRRSTLVTSQLPVGSWHASLGDPTLADAILDRLVHNAYKIELKGESLRKKRAMTNQEQGGDEARG
jgi:DNA replication protein DnaC